MIISWNWLKDYVDAETKNINIVDFCNRMIMSGSNLETCEEQGLGISKVVVGIIEKIEKHPDADKLVVCQLNVGENDLVQIVTGAPNVYEGALVPVALHKSLIPGPLHGQPKVEGGVKIKKGKLRGVESFGMLCSASELGFDDKVSPYISKDGIWLFNDELAEKIGMEITEALGIDDYIIDFEITPNRPDCLSVIGMARETIATFDGTMHYPALDFDVTEDKVEDFLEVKVLSSNCKRYTARVIKDLVIEQSPWWLQKRLMASGVRPINNIVDITNFVMLEYGQPLHAFDIELLKGKKIIVENAKEDETFVTLDEKERVLDESMLMIKDSQRSVAIAGIMGGLNSGITEDTKVMVLESANFEADNIRKTSKALGLRTESSSRFEKGIDPNLCMEASDRFCHLIEEIGAGKVVSGIIDIYNGVRVSETVKVRASRVNKVLGTDISKEIMINILEKLECKVTLDSDDEDILLVTPPTIRLDLEKEYDFIEEIARIYGYDRLPMTLPKGNEIAKTSNSWKIRNVVRDSLCAMGADEIQTFSFVSPRDLELVCLNSQVGEEEILKLKNSLGEDTSVMRTYLLPQMLEVLSRNHARKVDEVRAFEIGTVFRVIGSDTLPKEEFNISLGLYGEDESFFTLKGMVIELLRELGIKKEDLRFVPVSNIGAYHPGRCAKVLYTGGDEEVELGIIGEIHPDVADNYSLDIRTYGGELYLEVIEQFGNKVIDYIRPPKYPSMKRDIALLVDEEVTIEKLENTIKGSSSELLKNTELFDIYRGEQVEAGKKSVAFSLTYRHDDRTLKDEEVDEAITKVIEALREETKAEIRDN